MDPSKSLKELKIDFVGESGQNDVLELTLKSPYIFEGKKK